MNKICTTCNIEQPIENFHKAKTKKDGYSYTCKLCRQLYHKKHYENNTHNYKQNANDQKNKIKVFLNNYKQTLQCEICKESRHYCLDFHHIENNKEYNISDMAGRGVSINTLMNEIAKCQILCKNCHAEIHFKEK